MRGAPAPGVLEGQVVADPIVACRLQQKIEDRVDAGLVSPLYSRAEQSRAFVVLVVQHRPGRVVLPQRKEVLESFRLLVLDGHHRDRLSKRILRLRQPLNGRIPLDRAERRNAHGHRAERDLGAARHAPGVHGHLLDPFRRRRFLVLFRLRVSSVLKGKHVAQAGALGEAFRDGKTYRRPPRCAVREAPPAR